MNKIVAQCYKELVQLRRDKLTLALVFLLPLMTLCIYGFALRLESRNIPLIVQDFDRNNLSNSYIERLYATNQFVAPKWSGQDPLREGIDVNIAKVAVIIPAEFSRDLKAGRSARVQVLIDATDVNNARVIKNSIQNVTNFFLREQGLIPLTNLIEPNIRLWFNPGRLESLYFVPGIYGVVLWIFPSLLTAIAMVREKERGTILQIYASSIRATELLLGKGLAYLLIALCEAILVIGFGTVIFQINLVGEPIILGISTLLFLTDSVLFGLLIGIYSNDQNTAVQGVSFIGFISSLMLSGFIYPLNNIPFPLSLLPFIVPTRYYIDITRDIFVRGTGWTEVWFDLLLLSLLAFVLYNLSHLGLSKMKLQ